MCLDPLRIGLLEYVDESSGEVKKRPILSPIVTCASNVTTALVPCGRCVECMSQKAKEWSFRIQDEMSLHAANCFLTLTFRENPLTICKRDLQTFVKRLRKSIEPCKIRYFACGEYGKKHGRPHYHLAVFGWRPADLVYLYTTNDGDRLYRSPTVEKLWPHGFITVGDLTLESGKYVAKYLQKLQDFPDGLEPPFLLMSNRPGIGYGAIDEKAVKTDKIYRQGQYIPIPRYYLKVLDRRGVDLRELRERRIQNGKLFRPNQVRIERKREILKLKFGTWHAPPKRRKQKDVEVCPIVHKH